MVLWQCIMHQSTTATLSQYGLKCSRFRVPQLQPIPHLTKSFPCSCACVATWHAQVMPATPCTGVENWDNSDGGNGCPGESIWDVAHTELVNAKRDAMWGMSINPVSRRGQHQVGQNRVISDTAHAKKPPDVHRLQPCCVRAVKLAAHTWPSSDIHS